jgi:carbon monoxide dehydrogenase subunit G
VKCFEDGKAEISLVTDITVFVNGNWSRVDDKSNEISLKITGGSVSGNLDGGGKLMLTADRKSITGLNLQVVNQATKKVIKASFVAK